MKQYIIAHDGGGWVYNSPIEGWIFTILETAATRFNSRKEAEAAIREHYRVRRLETSGFHVREMKE